MKKIKQDDILQKFEDINKEAGERERAEKLLDSQLFTLNVNKDGLKKKREKLAADRFREKDKGSHKSPTETAILKKLALKNPPQKQNIKPIDPFMDLWADGNTFSKKSQKFKDFSKSAMPKVKAILNPMGGQSFNPSATAHKSVLKQVLVEEEKDIEAEYRGSLAHIKEGAAAAKKDIED